MRPIAELPSGFWWVGLTLLLVLTWCLTSFWLFLITTVRLARRQLVFVCLWCVWLRQGRSTALRVKLSNSRTILNLWRGITAQHYSGGNWWKNEDWGKSCTWSTELLKGEKWVKWIWCNEFVTLQCPAGKPWVLSFTWKPLHMHPQQDNVTCHTWNTALVWSIQGAALKASTWPSDSLDPNLIRHPFDEPEQVWYKAGPPSNPHESKELQLLSWCQKPENTPRGLVSKPWRIRANVWYTVWPLWIKLVPEHPTV